MPSISVVTPSYGQARFIERTIESVLGQGIADLEYFVVDGGSRDGTVDILRRYDGRLRWVSEPDRGQTDAVNKGIRGTTAPIIGWLNSDDVYYPGAVGKVLDFFAANPDVDVVYGDADHIDADDGVMEPYYTESWDFERLKDVCYLCQPAVFFRRSAVERVGLLDESLNYCMDYDLWLRMAQAGCRFAHLRERLAGSRLHQDTKTLGSRLKVHAELNTMLRRTLGKVPDRWLSNYAHVQLENRPTLQARRPAFILAVSTLTMLASLRWNGAITPGVRTMVRGWLGGAFPRLAQRRG